MIALFDEVPSYCPQCGRPIDVTRWNIRDFHAGSALRCGPCQFQYGYSEQGQLALLAVATNGAPSDWKEFLP